MSAEPAAKPPTRTPLETLREKVRVGLLYGTCIGVALSNDSNRWGKTIRFKPISDEEALELAEVLKLAVEEARKNREAEQAAKAVAQ
jgi:hypothetical protein